MQELIEMKKAIACVVGSIAIVSLLLFAGFEAGYKVGEEVYSATPEVLADPANGVFQIRNKKYGDVLRPEGGRRDDGTRLVLYPGHPWRCVSWKLASVESDGFVLENDDTGKLFAASASVGEDTMRGLVQVPLSAEAASRPVWNFAKLPDGTYRIFDRRSGLSLTAHVAGGSGKLREPQAESVGHSKFHVALAQWMESDEQRWEVIKAPNRRW